MKRVPQVSGVSITAARASAPCQRSRGKACWPVRTPSTTDFLMVRMRPKGKVVRFFELAQCPWPGCAAPPGSWEGSFWVGTACKPWPTRMPVSPGPPSQPRGQCPWPCAELPALAQRPPPPRGHVGAQRPLGSGVIMAAAQAHGAPPGRVDEALAVMGRPQQDLVQLLRRHGCRACTDVTGFGLFGHLGEMIQASPSGIQVQLDPRRIPAYDG
ncbi:MAG TPA: hypothetical protein DD643_06880, partial [Synechococcus sp. UBA8638]|nr:hypothetical protein [Synechococcus sp. UBA8638]